MKKVVSSHRSGVQSRQLRVQPGKEGGEKVVKMVPTTGQKWPFVLNLGNSIIGVAILTMPFCFKQCGILLGAVVLLFCTWLTLASCQLLVKAGIMSHYQSYEFLAYHTYGAAGKFLVEMGMIGMQLGTLVAQIVVIGDLGPPIISRVFGFENNWYTRMVLIIILCLCVGLPLGLMKDLRNVSRASAICIMFYFLFVLYVLWLSLDNLWKAEWFSHVEFWRPQGFFRCLPIISFSFGCQTQLFILYDALPDPSLPAIKGIIHSAVNLCCMAYLLVGFLSYVTFYHLDIPGDIITVFPATVGTLLVKVGFVMSIAITFPVIIYPCRASIYTLLFQKKSKHSDIVSGTYIPEHLFKGITIAIVMGSMITAILIPNVEFVLGLNGAITGTLICYIFPALFFLRVSKPEGRTVAKIVLFLGVAILVISTFTTLYAQDKAGPALGGKQEDKVPPQVLDLPKDVAQEREPALIPPKEGEKPASVRRLEPPNPFAPVEGVKVDDAKVAAEKLAELKAKKAEKQALEAQQAQVLAADHAVKREEDNKQDLPQPMGVDAGVGARQIQGVANQPGGAAGIKQPAVDHDTGLAQAGDVGALNPPQAAAQGMGAVNQGAKKAQGIAKMDQQEVNQQVGNMNQQGVDMNQQGSNMNQQGVRMNQQGGNMNQQGGNMNQQGVKQDGNMNQQGVAQGVGQAGNEGVVGAQAGQPVGQQNQGLGLAQGQNVGLKPPAMAQDIEDNVVEQQQPAEGVGQQGVLQAQQGMAQPQGQAQQAAPGLPQGGLEQQAPGLPQGDAGLHAQAGAQQAAVNPVQQQQAPDQAVVQQQKDKAALGQGAGLQDRDNLADRQAPPQHQQQEVPDSGL